MYKIISVLLFFCFYLIVIPGCGHKENTLNFPNNQYELDSGWVCKNIKEVKLSGEELSKPSSSLTDWMPAKFPELF